MFLSYRRSDALVVGRVADHLRKRFKTVFYDVLSIGAAQQFPKVISEHLDKSDLVVVMIGPGWTLESNVERDGKDWVGIELSGARTRKIPVVPVLLDGASMPTAAALSDDFSWLVDIHGITLRSADPGFTRDIDTVAAALRTVHDHDTDHDDDTDEGLPASLIFMRVLAGLIVIALIVGLVVRFLDDDDPDDVVGTVPSSDVVGTDPSSNVVETSSPPTGPIDPGTPRWRLDGGNELQPGDFMESADGLHRLEMAHDGTLEGSTNGVVWWDEAHGPPGSWANMQLDGNFVVYQPASLDPENKDPAWASETNGLDGAHLELVDVDGHGEVRIVDIDGHIRWTRPEQPEPTTEPTAPPTVEFVPTRDVPNVEGMTEDAAIARLHDAGFQSHATEQPSIEFSPGIVISTDPEPGSPRQAGSLIEMIVASEGVQVPNVEGMKENEATAVIRGVNLDVRTTTAMLSQRPRGEVVGQHPDPGQVVAMGSLITIEVSSGPPVVEG